MRSEGAPWVVSLEEKHQRKVSSCNCVLSRSDGVLKKAGSKIPFLLALELPLGDLQLLDTALTAGKPEPLPLPWHSCAMKAGPGQSKAPAPLPKAIWNLS